MWVLGKGKAMKEIAVKDITLKGGLDRTVMSETGLAPETHLEYLSCYRGKTSFYRIKGTEDAIVIKHHFDPDYDFVYVEKRFFSREKIYARKVQQLTQWYHLPFELGLALGDKEANYEAFTMALLDMKMNDTILLELSSGRTRRKAALMKVLGEKLYNSLNIPFMSRMNTKRIADYLLKHCEAKLS